jgi:GNAT superfamily N-acetyltransferase
MTYALVIFFYIFIQSTDTDYSDKESKITLYDSQSRYYYVIFQNPVSIESVQFKYPSESIYFSHIFSNNMKGIFRICGFTEDNKVIAACKVNSYDRDANLAWLFVSKKHRNKGVGKKLIELSKEMAHAIGRKQLRVTPQPFGNSTKTIDELIAWYKKNGFDLNQDGALFSHTKTL